MFLVGTYLVLQTLSKTLGLVFSWLGTTGYCLARLAALVVFPNRDKLQQMLGTVDAIEDILGNKIPQDKY